MELRDIRIFVQVARDGNFSMTARRLSLAPSSVSKAITRLENELQLRLFQRSSRSVRLTDEGQHFLEAAYRVVDALAEAESIGTATPLGTLVVRSVPTFARYQLAPLMPRFRQIYPQLRIEFRLTNDQTASLDDGSDIAIVSGHLPSSTLVARRIATSRWVVCAAPEYLATHGCPASMAELANHECLNFSMATPWNRWACDDRNMRPEVSGHFSANQGDMLLALARAGTGIVRLAEFHIHEDLSTGRLVPLFFETDDLSEEPIYAIYRDRRRQSPRLRAFLDFLTEHLSIPPWRSHNTE